MCACHNEKKVPDEACVWVGVCVGGGGGGGGESDIDHCARRVYMQHRMSQNLWSAFV